LIAVCVGSVVLGNPSSSSAQGRTVTLSPSVDLKAGDIVTVTWSGFTPGRQVYLYECAASAARWSGCAEVSYVKGVTQSDGTGSVAFPIWRGVPLPTMPVVGTRNFGIACNASNPCDVVVSECGFDIDSDRATKAPIDFAPGGTNPSVTTTMPFATSTTTTPDIQPITADPLTTAYSSSMHLLLNALKFRALQAPHEVNIDLLTQNSPNALEQFVSGGSEVAMGALPLDAAQLAELDAQGRDVAYVPIAVSALTVGQQLTVNGIESEEFNLSADSLARIYNSPEPGETWSQIANWNDPALVEENGGCDIQLDGRRYPVASRRGDVSAPNLVFTSWLDSQAPTWNLGTGLVMPINDSQVYARPSAEELANFIAVGDLAIDHATSSSAGRVGFVDRSYAREFGLTQVALKNGAGEFVQPTDDAINKALATDYEPGTFFFPKMDSTVPGAYPMPTVYYAIVQTNVAGSYTQENADDLKTFLELVVSSEGQDRAAALGFVPLSADMRAEAQAAIEMIGKPVAAPSAPTTTVTGSEPGTDESSSPDDFTPLDGGTNDLSTGSESGFVDDASSSADPSSDAATTPTTAADAPKATTPDVAAASARRIRTVLASAPLLITLPALFVAGLAVAFLGRLVKRGTRSGGAA